MISQRSFDINCFEDTQSVWRSSIVEEKVIAYPVEKTRMVSRQIMIFYSPKEFMSSQRPPKRKDFRVIESLGVHSKYIKAFTAFSCYFGHRTSVRSKSWAIYVVIVQLYWLPQKSQPLEQTCRTAHPLTGIEFNNQMGRLYHW